METSIGGLPNLADMNLSPTGTPLNQHHSNNLSNQHNQQQAHQQHLQYGNQTKLTSQSIEGSPSMGMGLLQGPMRIVPSPLRGATFPGANTGFDVGLEADRRVPVLSPAMTLDLGLGGIGNGLARLPSSTTDSPPGGKPIRRRMRMITSCLECRRRKLKCNKSQPCENCFKFNRECNYLGSKLDEASQMKLTEIKEKVGSLERQLERDVASRNLRGPHQQRIMADDVDEDFREGRDLEITPMVALDLTYDDDDDMMDGRDDMIDLGIQVGRMRITERIGGLNRPRIAEEIQAGLNDGQQPSANAGYLSAPELDSNMYDGDSPIPGFLRPGSTYIPPTSGFSVGQMETPAFIELLPEEQFGHRLLRQYLEAVHPIARCVHQPTLEAQYTVFWSDVSQMYEPRASIQALIFAAWFSAVVSFDEAGLAEYGYNKSQLVQRMKVATEIALSKANFLRSTKVDVMQAFVMYLIPLCRAEISRAHSVLVGAAVRMAECMGLHRDGSAYGLNPLETHVRRLIWHQLCFLDIRTCEAQGPKPAIKRDDYDTRMPLNCEDEELTEAQLFPDAGEQWTSMTLPVMRFQINEVMRSIWSDRRKLENRDNRDNRGDRKTTTLASVLTKIKKFQKALYERFGRTIDDRVPIQRYANLVMHLLVYRLYAMALHPYYANASNPMPETLNSVLIMSGIMIIEIAIQLEQEPLFRDWAWYLGAYQQYQIALLLATEQYYRPNNPQADRIWHCLDYVFNLTPGLPRDQKSRQILTEIMSKSSVYMKLRKMRAPTGISKAVPGRQAVHSESQQQQGNAAASPMHLSALSSITNIQAPHRHTAQQAQQVYYDQQTAGLAALTAVAIVTPPSLKTEPGISMPPPLPPPPPADVLAGMEMMAGLGGAMPSVGLLPSNNAPNIVFAGASNGEALWTLPPNPGSPDNSSDGGSVVGAPQQPAAMIGGGGAMSDIDWDAINALFPQDPQTGRVSFAGFVDPGIGMKWQG